MANIPENLGGSIGTVYVVPKENIPELKKSGRDLSDIAYVERVDSGRDNAKIALLVWAKDPTKTIAVYEYDGKNGIRRD